MTVTTTAIAEPSPSPKCTVSNTSEKVLLTETTIITKTLSKLCSCSELGHDNMLNMILSTANQTLPPALGALLGIAVIALVVTTMGWIWTCWRMKKRGGIKINSDEQER